jgi:SAM-dependent MidA family methyltransferase
LKNASILAIQGLLSKSVAEEPLPANLVTEIATILRQEAERQGVISFARFMELSLYCPEIGYYEREEGRVGRDGDFYTSVSVGPLFGGLLAFQFAQWADQLEGSTFQVVEAGAHDGRLAKDILSWLETKRTRLMERLEYWLVEPSPRRQSWQRKQLDKFADRLRWVDSLERLPSTGVHGVIFSNELLDAFPVHRLGWDARARRWIEWGVTWDGTQFVWAKMERSSDRCDRILAEAGLEVPDELSALLPDGFTVELSPDAAAWWRRAAERLRCGRLLTFDYGLTAEQFLAPERSHGTLRAYHKHAIVDDLLANPGEQDFTAHVNFTHLQRAGESAGLRSEGLLSQTQFLTQIAEGTWREEATLGPWTPTQVRQFQTLTHPEHLGRAFRVLLQSRLVTRADELNAALAVGAAGRSETRAARP